MPIVVYDLSNNKRFMAKLYSRTPRRERVDENLVPKEETIKFLLAYSSALSVINFKSKKFDLVLN